MRTERLGAFSDGVFAIAATLLVLEIHAPTLTASGFWVRLGSEWPAFVAYAVSFITIGIAWVNHHAMLESLAGADRNVLFLNLVLLLAIGFVPFPTGLLATAFRDGTAERQTCLLYAATWLFASSVFTALWWYLATRTPYLLKEGASFGMARLHRSWTGPALYGLAMIASLIRPQAALALFAVIAVWFIHPGKGHLSVDDE